MRVVDALPAIRSSRFDLPLTYDAARSSSRVGDVVRVPLGNARGDRLRRFAGARDAPSRSSRSSRCSSDSTFRAPSTRSGLHSARFVAERYICTLGEALAPRSCWRTRFRACAIRSSVAGPAPEPHRFPLDSAATDSA